MTSVGAGNFFLSKKFDLHRLHELRFPHILALIVNKTTVMHHVKHMALVVKNIINHGILMINLMFPGSVFSIFPDSKLYKKWKTWKNKVGLKTKSVTVIYFCHLVQKLVPKEKVYLGSIYNVYIFHKCDIVNLMRFWSDLFIINEKNTNLMIASV